MDATQRLAVFAHALEFRALPSSTVSACSRLVLDTIASAIPAWDLPGIRELRALLKDWCAGRCHVWVSGEGLSPAAATLVNSAMSHALEYDDLHSELPVHIGAVIVPVALTVAQIRPQLTGADLTVAIVAGA